MSGFTRRAETEGRGQPTEPSMRSESWRPQESAMPTSVMPKRSSRMLPLERSVQACLVGVGRAAEPEMLRRRCLRWIACLVAVWSSGERVGCDCSSLDQTVGTAVKKVIGGLEIVGPWPFVCRKGAAKRCQTWVGLKGYMNSMLEPASKGARSALTVPWMWWRGRM